VRTPIFQAFPRVGTPRAFSGYDHYVETVDRLLRCQAIPDPTYLWWDVRPQPRFGTVEIRIMDAQSESWETHALIALVQAIAHLELEEGYHVNPLVGSPEIVAENRFAAARDGAHARLIDPVRETLVPVTEALEHLLTAAEPHARALHIDGALDDVRRLAADPGSERQRRAAGSSGPPTAVVNWLAEVF
jgi:carboxylate-amine ligase